MTARKALYIAFPLAILVAATMLLGGCGSESRNPEEMLEAAIQAVRDAGSAHAQMNVAVSPLEDEAGMGLNVMGDAWLDMDAGVLDSRFTVMGLELSLRYVDGTAYLQFGGEWYVFTPDIIGGVGEGTIEALMDVLASIPDIFASSVEVKELGQEKVGDFECTRMQVIPDLRTISRMESVEKLAVELGMEADELLAYLEDADIAIEVCVQNDEPVIREAYLAASTELPSMGDMVGIALLPEIARVEITMNFPEYGMELEIEAPSETSPFEGL